MAIGAFGEVPTTRKPAGGRVTLRQHSFSSVGAIERITGAEVWHRNDYAGNQAKCVAMAWYLFLPYPDAGTLSCFGSRLHDAVASVSGGAEGAGGSRLITR